jgi:hypothetical protein
VIWADRAVEKRGWARNEAVGLGSSFILFPFILSSYFIFFVSSFNLNLNFEDKLVLH